MAHWHRLVLAGLIGLAAAQPARTANRPSALSTAAFDPPVYDGVRLEGSGAGAGRLVYRFVGGRDWPAIRLRVATPLDWSRAGALTFDVENPGPSPFHLLVRIDDDPHADGGDGSLTGVTDIAAHQRRTIVLPLDAGAFEPGAAAMRGRPPGVLGTLPGDQVITERRGTTDLHHVWALHISGFKTDTDRVLLIGPPGLRLQPDGPRPSGPLADAFGQWVQGDWPEKVKSVADLRAKLKAAAVEVRRLDAQPVPVVDRFGGVETQPPSRATGFFRVERMQDRWTLVTPAGHRFFSLGVDTVAASNPTIVAGRLAAFQDLPAEAANAETYDIGAANIERGLGSTWRTRWPQEVTARLKGWGFNTLGNWSDPGLAASAKLAHVVFYDVEGRSAMVPMTGGRSLPDPFDPLFAGVADDVAARMTQANAADATLLGYFSGNELPWGTADRLADGIAAHVMRLGADSPAKQALVAGLRAAHVSAAGLADAWAIPRVDSWDALLNQPMAFPVSLTDAARSDIIGFQARFAEAYFRTVALAIKAHDPNHLYLGTRFASFTPEVVRACAHWCDVMSFNVYGPSPQVEVAGWLSLDKPVLIGEFHFGSTDRGSFWPGMVAVGREDDRGPAYAAYVDAAVADRQIVGVHWYQYADEPLTGRPYDGENGHIGLVAVTDVPYAAFVAEVAEANRRALERFVAPRPQLP